MVNKTVNMTFGLSVVDGFVGLGPKWTEDSSSDLFINKLISAKIISKPVFALAFFLNSTYLKNSSKIHLGGYSDAFVLARYTAAERGNLTSAQLITWLNITSETSW
jgi:hypothetical protein